MCVCVCVCVCEIRRQVISDQAFVRKLLSVFWCLIASQTWWLRLMITQKGREVTPQRKKEMVALHPRLRYSEWKISEVRNMFFELPVRNLPPIQPPMREVPIPSSVLFSCRWHTSGHIFHYLPSPALQEDSLLTKLPGKTPVITTIPNECWKIYFFLWFPGRTYINILLKTESEAVCIYIWRSARFSDSQDHLNH